MEPKYRIQVNVRQSDKGILTFDCSVESEQTDGRVFLLFEKVDRLVSLLGTKYNVRSQKSILGHKSDRVE